MKTFKLLAISSAIMLIFCFTGCASMQLVSVEQDTVVGPERVRQGTNINPREIQVWGIYKNGDRRLVSISANNIIYNKSTPGPQRVQVRAGNHAVSFMTEIMALRSLTVASPPRVVLFKEGQAADAGWPGLEIRGEWDQMGSDRIELSLCEITGYTPNQPGRQVIRVSYEGLQATFDVEVRSMASIVIAQNPTKLDYFQGESLDITGLVVRGVWGDGFPDEDLSVTRNDVTGFNGNQAGVQRLTVTKNGRTANFTVEVLALTSIVLEKPPTRTDYYAGDALDLTGIEVTGNYTGADPTKRRSVLIPIDQLTTSGYEANRIGRQQRVTVMAGGQSANFFVNIETRPASAPAATPPAATTPPASGTTVTLSPSNPTASVTITSGNRVAITVSAAGVVQSSNNGVLDPSLFSAATGGTPVADDEADGTNWRYAFSAGQTLYAGFYQGTVAGTYTVTATFGDAASAVGVSLTRANPTAVINITQARQCVGISVSGAARIESSNVVGNGDPALYMDAERDHIIADDEVDGRNWRFNVLSARTVYAGFYGTHTGSYTVTATFQ